ncbi:retrovirus-related Pol polyprotein from transposon 412 [Trichonephila clavipes]|nr:retrovirus-related Pol polyprotein from transposon 412 [Trichonephila clavipes]
MVERFNRTILNNLSLMVSKNQQDWDQKVPLFLLAYRSAVHETTGYSPSQMLFGRDLRLPCDLLFGRPPDTPSSPEEYVQNLQARFEDVHNLARERINLRTEKMKTRYDTKATGHQFKEGDKVWFYNPTRRKGLSPKLQSHWDGPYTILKIINDVVIRILFSSIVRDFLELFYNLWRTVLAKNKIVLDPALRLQSFRTPENATISYPEARHIVSSRTPFTGVSYAAAAKKSQISASTQYNLDDLKNQTPLSPVKSSNTKLVVTDKTVSNTSNQKPSHKKRFERLKDSKVLQNKKEDPTCLKKTHQTSEVDMLDLHGSEDEESLMGDLSPTLPTSSSKQGASAKNS